VALFKPVSALERGLSVLAVVSKRGRARVTEVREETGLDKATIIRMLETLAHAGYVEKHPLDATYSTTGRTIDFGRGFGPHRRLSDLTSSIIQEFRSETGWPSDFAVPDGDAMFTVDTGSDRSPLLSQVAVGYRPHLLLTSLGLVYLAFCADEEQRRLLDRVSDADLPEAKKQLRNIPKLRKTFSHVRVTGYASGDPEYAKRMASEMIWPMAVPVMDQQRVYGAVNIYMVKNAHSEEEAVAKYLARLQDLANRLMNALENEKSSFPSGPRFVS
jgi:IclR family transcriptional regulator, mhp operon transcriptional activator